MHLGTQLLASALLVILMTLVHGLGVVGITKLLKLEDATLKAHRLDHRALGLLTSMALLFFTLHAVEIAVFAGFYLAVGAVATVEQGLYYSASAYSTLGHPDVDFPDRWRLTGAIEGVVGFLLLGWSTAVFVTDMNKVLRK